MCKPSQIDDTKRLFEGLGCNLENKYAHSFTGFEGAYTVLTCNRLMAPFIEPTSSLSGWDKQSFEVEQLALNARCSYIHFTEMFDADTEVFPFDV